VTVTALDGYEAASLTVTDKDGNPVAVTRNPDGTFSFIQPKGGVTISAAVRQIEGAQECPRDNTCPIWRFPDASTTAWYHDGVHYCLEHGLMTGYDNGNFGPEDTLSRAMLSQILYNEAGRPQGAPSAGFTDVPANAWYANAVNWAASRGVVTGYGDGRFGPDDPITREQLAAMLWRNAKAAGRDVSVGENTNILGFPDFPAVSEWAVPALQWAAGAGVMTGKDGGRLDPAGQATRAEAATMLMRYLKNA